MRYYMIYNSLKYFRFSKFFIRIFLIHKFFFFLYIFSNLVLDNLRSCCRNVPIYSIVSYQLNPVSHIPHGQFLCCRANSRIFEIKFRDFVSFSRYIIFGGNHRIVSHAGTHASWITHHFMEVVVA